MPGKWEYACQQPVVHNCASGSHAKPKSGRQPIVMAAMAAMTVWTINVACELLWCASPEAYSGRVGLAVGLDGTTSTEASEGAERPVLAVVNRNRALLALTLTALIWGSTPVAVRSLVKDLPPADVLVMRFLISGAIFCVVLTVQRGWGIAWRDVPRFVAAGLSGVTGYNVLVNYGLAITPASLSGLILGTEPLFIALFAALILGERIGAATGIGLALASAGAAVLVLGQGNPSTALASGNLGPLLVFASGVLWSYYVVLMKPLLATYGPVRASALTSLIGLLPVLAMASPHTWDVALAFTPVQWALLLFQAVLGTVISIFLWNYGCKFVSSARAAAFIYAVPLVAVLTGVVLLNEPLTSGLILGGAMVLAGVAIAQFVRR